MTDEVAAYVASLPPRQAVLVAAVRDLIIANLPAGYHEEMGSGMICYVVPMSRGGPTYNGKPLMYVALAGQRRYVSLYLLGVYGPREAEFRARYAATGHKLNMGRSCVRFTKLDDLALDVIAAEIAAVPVEQHLANYHAARASGGTR